MSQPVWQLVAQLGDMNPTEYGGYWIFEDTSGAYELDSYPLRLSRAEIVERYSEHPYLRSN